VHYSLSAHYSQLPLPPIYISLPTGAITANLSILRGQHRNIWWLKVIRVISLCENTLELITHEHIFYKSRNQFLNLKHIW